MALFDIFKKKEKQPKPAYPASGKYVDKNSIRYELEMKARAGKPMTADEHEALQRYRTRDVWDQVFRIAGVVTVLFIILLAVFIFLYPYSLFNVFPTSHGGKDTFWHMLSSWHVYVGNSDTTWLGTEADASGYVEMSKLYDVAFQTMKTIGIDEETGEVLEMATGFDFKCGVYVMGSWTICIVATVGFIGAIIGASFILASNIKNLIGVIRHLSFKTVDTISNLGETAKDAYQEAVPEAKKKTTRKKKEEKPAEDVVDEEEDVAKRVEELKVEIAEEEAKVEQPKIAPVTEAPKAEKPAPKPSKYDNLGDADIDRLLSGK